MGNVIAVAGDWHVNADWAVLALEGIASVGVEDIYHVGDFGFFPDPDAQNYVATVDECINRLGLNLFVTPGNHDDYVFINSLPVADDGFKYVSDRLRVVPRGHRWVSGGRSFVSLGGAASIDFEGLTEGITWWRDEAITYGDVMRTAGGGQAEIMIAHEAPNGIQALAWTDKADQSKHSVEALQYAFESRSMMTHAVDGVKPDFFFHGHYHNAYMEDATLGLPDDSFTMKAVGLGKDNDYSGNVALMDLTDLSIGFFTLER